ncbi:MAG: ImmA/IrrE family metallo-endopeptidase, partial [Acidobacteriota bacterium]
MGERLRQATGIAVEEQLRWRDEHRTWRAWRDRAEKLGVLVFQFPGVPVGEVRGTTLFAHPLPVIGVNSREIASSRPFTLLYELAHLMLAQSGVERPAAHEVRRDNEWQTAERFSEAVAAAVPAAPSEACFTLHLSCFGVGDSVQSSSARLSNLLICHRSSAICGAD